MDEPLEIRNMTREEVGELVDWAAREGWNPGLHDADVFWATDREAFLAVECEGALAGGGAITSYAREFGFMGFFIVRPEFRGRGLGDRLWHARRERLLGRLQPGATVGLDGVFEMQSYYARGGFVFSHRNMRFRVEVASEVVDPQAAAGRPGVVPLASVPRLVLEAYDRTCFPAPRPTFLRAWLALPDSRALAYRSGGILRGYGVIRRCGDGCKIGPLFADDAAVAEALYAALAPFAAGGALFLDAPENNPAAMDLVRRHGMDEVFGCARMYLGPMPDLAHQRIFGVTTFELG